MDFNLSGLTPLVLTPQQGQDSQQKDFDLSGLAPISVKKKPDGIKIISTSNNPPTKISDLPDIPVGTIPEPRIKKNDFNFSGLEPIKISSSSNNDENYDGEVLRIDSTKQTAPKLATINQEDDKRSFIGKAVSNISRMNEPDVTNKNPKGIIREIKFTLPANPDGSLPNQSEISSAFLSQLGVDYANVGETFKSQTGLDLAQISQQELPSAIIGKRVVDGKTYYDFGAKLTQGTLDLINAYNESGLEGYRSEWENQFRTNQKFNKEWQQHEDFYSGFRGDIRRAFGNAAIGVGQRIENLKTILNGESLGDIISSSLGKAGKNEQTRIADQKSLDEARTILGSYKTGLGGLVGETINAGVFVAGLGPVPIATVYLDNLHRGQGEALKAAAGMALMQAAGHFIGNIADGASFNPASRQILIRGSQGTMNYLFAALNGEKDPSALFNQFAVGHFFPAGKGGEVDEFTNKLNIPTIIDRTPIDAFVAPSVKEQVKQQLLLAAPKVDVPLNNSTTNITSGDVLRPRESTEFVGTSGYPRENVGFEAKASPQNIKMNLEDANALLLDLQRYRESGEGKDLEITQAQILDKAILNLQNAIPQEFQDYFAKNEKTIRDALRPKTETKRDETRVITQEGNTEKTISGNIEGDSITGKESPVEFLNKVRDNFNTKTPNPENIQEDVPDENRNEAVLLENYKQRMGTLEEAATNFFQNETPQLDAEDYAIELLKDRGISVTKDYATRNFILNIEGQIVEVAPEDFIAKARQIDQRLSTELDALTKPLSKEMPPPINSDGTVFNSGLNPEEFIKQARLLWGGIKDFGTFSRTLIEKFGEGIKPYLISLRSWIADEFRIKGNEESQQGFLGIKLNPPKNPALEKFLETPLENLEISKGKKADKRFAMRSVAVMQLHPDTFGPIWNTLADAEGLTNSYKSKLVQDIHAANKLLEGGLENDVATALYEGDKDKKVYSPAELKANFNLSPEQIQAYQKIRQAQDRVLEMNLLTKVYPLWQKLSTFVVGSPDYNDLLKQINSTTGYYQGLKNRGYVTRQRLGKIAVFAEDPAFPIGDVRRKLYTQVENQKEAVATLTQWFNEYGAVNGDSHFINKKNMIAELQFLANKITPAAIENLIDSSTADRNDPQIVRLVDEVYNRFPSSSYELKRDYTRGMEESWKGLLINLAHQNEVYSNKYYSKIGGEHAKLQLGQLNLLKTDPNLYKIAASFIQDATTPYEGDWFQKLSAKARSKVYFMQLGYQFWQFVNNGITQPMQQTYSYFGRVENNGVKLTGAEPETYFSQGLKLAKEVMKENLGKASSSMPQEFRDIYQRLQDEHLVTQEFTRSLMEGEINKSTLDIEKEVGLRKSRLGQKLTKEWPSVFQEKGEKTTRTITAAEAYLVGSEKFKLAGEELYKFIRTAIVSTQGAFGKGENPYLVRKAGEVGKLFYQFSSYNQMWLENLGLAIKADRDLGRFTATPRHILPILLTAGMKGLPAYAFAKTLYTLLTGKNPEEEFKKALKDHQLLANFALYGISSNAGVSAKLGATIPVLDNLAQIITDPSQELSFENVPAINTFMQVGKGIIDLTQKGQRLRGLEEISPTAIKNILKAARYNREGVKSKSGQTEVPASHINGLQKGMQFFGVTPPAVSEHYEKKRMDNVKKAGKPIRKFLKIGH